ncbi:VCBS repeat-containing protein [Flagellimonas amoyensis]|uniref:VCBS repeat-containing protein n=1 Tax=Flagellimonas amoyensis TaxID=2169401 RepID=UPI001900B726|nr:VCBS repeat-containing protein [Allomuricauda amoyensis]
MDKRFTLLDPDDTGVSFVNILRETETFNVFEYGYMYNGGGGAVGDLNNDGLPDIYFTGNMVGSHLYINQGDFRFKEMAKEAGVYAEGLWNTGTTMADVNSDGLLDIYVCRSAAKDPANRRNLLFINNGDLTFTESAKEYGIDDSGYSTQGVFFDYDGDGDLDLYVLNHSTQDYAGFSQITSTLKKKSNDAFSDKLYRNDNGFFTDVSQSAGLVSNVLGFGLGVAVSDINNDGWLDLYISNDYNEQDYLYINNGNGTFKESLEEYMEHVSQFSMGSDAADINNDGFIDIVTLDMLPEGNLRQKMVLGPDNYDKYSLLAKTGFHNQSMRNMLQLNNGGKSFSEIGQLSGISNTDWSWAPLFADFDLDGQKDLFISNGYKRDYTNMDFMNFAVQERLKAKKTRKDIEVMNLIKEIPPIVEENYIYQNKGNLTFAKMNREWGLDQKTLSNGAAYADLDNDGDLDLIVNNIDEKASIYRNNSRETGDNGFLKIQLKGQKGNSFGIGAKVVLKLEDEIMVQEMITTRGYQSSVEPNMIFGVGKAQKVDELSIVWPDGRKQTLKDIPINQTVVLQHKEATNGNMDTEEAHMKPYFTEVALDSIIPYAHKENPYVDFRRDRLLPHMLSTQGPRLTVADVNGDGLDDIFIGGAKGSPGKLYIQTASGEFMATNEALFEQDQNSEDVEALFFDADRDGDMDLYVTSGGNEFEKDDAHLQDRLYLNVGKGRFEKKQDFLPVMTTSTASVVANDFDKDGDLDLFVGGRLVPGEYPFAPKSYILENAGNGQFKDVTKTVAPDLEHLGMITDALWSDYDSDGTEELIIVGEFMGIRLFKYQNGTFTEHKDSGLTNTEGWWNTIKAGDFDNDGDIDYVLGNYGLNTQLTPSTDAPLEIYAKDFDGNGSIDPILCSYFDGRRYPVFSKDDLVEQLSMLKSRYVNYSDYADQQLTDIFPQDVLNTALVLKAVNFHSSYMENLGNGKFKLHSLPQMAQFAPVHAMAVNDFNGDGNLDVLLAGNFYGNRVKFGRIDANSGTLLLGKGNGEFDVEKNNSGLMVKGEVRDLGTIDHKNKGKVILFAINDQPLKSYLITN